MNIYIYIYRSPWCKNISVYVCMYVCMYICMYVCRRVRVCACVSSAAYLCICGGGIERWEDFTFIYEQISWNRRTPSEFRYYTVEITFKKVDVVMLVWTLKNIWVLTFWKLKGSSNIFALIPATLLNCFIYLIAK